MKVKLGKKQEEKKEEKAEEKSGKKKKKGMPLHSAAKKFMNSMMQGDAGYMATNVHK